MSNIWTSYCQATNETALYPEAGEGSQIELAYLSLGLIGELGEFGELVIKEVQGIQNDKKFAELGDCFWYIARLSLFSYDISERLIVPTFHNCITASYQESMGRLANSSKKIIRDRGAIDKFVAHVQSAADDLATLYAVDAFKVRPEPDEFWEALDRDVLQPNLDKLRSRLHRGAIKGDGDNR